MKKNYTIEILYDNGIVENYETGEITEEGLIDFLNTFYKSFRDNSSAVAQVPNGKGSNAFINVSKVTRVNVLPQGDE